MKGQFKVQITKRRFNNSPYYKDKWIHEDKLIFINIIYDNKKYFKCISGRRGLQSMLITRDELAFVRLVFNYFGAGDYCIKTWGKGKKGGTGYRIFWDGIINNDRKFIRRRNTGLLKLNTSVFERESFSEHSEQKISDYMKTKRPGLWYNF